MSTPQPTPASLPEALNDHEQRCKAKLAEIHAELKEEGVNAENLAVFALDTRESVIGELHGADAYRVGETEAEYVRASIFETEDFVSVKDPKRISRMLARDPKSGAVGEHFQFGDFDWVFDGTVELRPIGAFFLDWTSYSSQLAYCHSYLSWLKGRRIARAKQAGIEIATSLPPELKKG